MFFVICQLNFKKINDYPEIQRRKKTKRQRELFLEE